MGQTIPSKLNMLSSIFLASAVAITTASPIRLQQQSMVIATFDGSSTRQWQDTNDPVMGGQSTSTFKVSNNTGVFDGHARIVPTPSWPDPQPQNTWVTDSDSPAITSQKPLSSVEGATKPDST